MTAYPVTVIIPVYNTGAYLEETLDSLFDQNFTDFECICVDDASDDRVTVDILTRYQRMYRRMRVIRLEERVSAAEARNIGFSSALSEYVIFLDSDDLFRKEMLEQMYEKIITTDSEVCFCGFRSFAVIQGERLYSEEKLPQVYENSLLERPENWLAYSWKAPWNKLIKRSFLKENNIQFQALSSADDIYFSVLLEIKARKICYCESALVDYRINNEKQMSAHRNPMNFYRAMERLFCELHVVEGSPLYPQLLLFLLDGVIGEMICAQNEDWSKKAYCAVQEFLNKSASDHPITIGIYRHIYDCFLHRPYESRWYENAFSYEFQYDIHRSEIQKSVAGYSRIILWGLGVRGIAFQKFCKTADITLAGCVDRKSRADELCTKYGVPVLDAEVVEDCADLIIACNDNIYEYVLKNISGIPVVNLQEYEDW